MKAVKTMKMTYLIADCYPQDDSDDFAKFTGAAIGCWIRPDLCSFPHDAYAVAQRKLDEIGWSTARLVRVQEVSAEDYATQNDGREYFEQAEIDGFVANLHVTAREVVGDDDPLDEDALAALRKVASMIISQGGVSLHSGKTRTWAVGTTPAGDDFVPMWQSRDQAAVWLNRWPGCRVRDIKKQDLRADVLEDINEKEMWIGLGISATRLVMCHPIWLQRAISIHST